MKGGRETKAVRRKTGMRGDFSCCPGIIICHEKFVRILMTRRFELLRRRSQNFCGNHSSFYFYLSTRELQNRRKLISIMRSDDSGSDSMQFRL